MTTLPVRPSTPPASRPIADVSVAMSGVRSEGTHPERLLRTALRRAGIRSFRTCDTSLPGKPDIVIPGKGLAIFVDGDYWHGNQYRLRGFNSFHDQLLGINNAEYWSQKIERNIDRDFKRTQELMAAGWRVIRFWESSIASSPENCVAAVVQALERKRPTSSSLLPARTVIELFAGIGLVRLGLRRAGWRTIFANDNDTEKFELYRANFGDERFDLRSIHDLAAADLPASSLVTASFPCNDLSLAGARNGLNGQHSSTFWALIRLLHEKKQARPPIVLLENVLGFITSRGGSDLESALLALNNLGYSCDVFVLDAADFAPQSRVRLFVIAKQATDSGLELPISPSKVRPPLLAEFINSHPTVKWSIRSLPELRSLRPNLDSIVEDLDEGDERWWNAQRAEYFMNQLSVRHARIAQHLIADHKISYCTAFRRIRNNKSMAELRADGIAGCLRTPRGGSGRQILFKAGYGRYAVRLLTPRECARLQGVQDEEFKIPVKDNQAFFGFGDAVCVPVIQWIGENYLNPLTSELMRGTPLLPHKRD